jgi:hypothetical protein
VGVALASAYSLGMERFPAFLHLVYSGFCTCSVSGTVLGLGSPAVSRTGKSSPLLELSHGERGARHQ